jgi:hypothetical protein
MASPAEKERFVQSVKALLIPLSLFVATLDLAAGGFLVYSGYAIGYAFIVIGITAIVVALVAFIRFQHH